MTALTLATAERILEAALAHAARTDMRPLTVAVLDAGGYLVALRRQDGTSPMRAEIAQGKARGAVLMGLGSRKLAERAGREPHFIQAMNALAGGSLVPVPGGVLIRNSAGEVVGAVGITGDSSDADEACAVAAVEAAGLAADPG